MLNDYFLRSNKSKIFFSEVTDDIPAEDRLVNPNNRLTDAGSFSGLTTSAGELTNYRIEPSLTVPNQELASNSGGGVGRFFIQKIADPHQVSFIFVNGFLQYLKQRNFHNN